MTETLKLKKVKPLMYNLITTMDTYEADVVDSLGLIDVTKRVGALKEYQKVVAVGPFVKEIKEGDLVCINPIRFGVKQHKEGTLKDGILTDNPVIKYNFDVIEINDVPHLMLRDSDISFVVEEFEVIKK